MERFGWPEAVVIVSKRPDMVAGLAPRFVPEMTEKNAVAWHEGGHERRFPIRDVLEDTPERFRFREDDAGETIELVPMTLELYEERVRPQTMGKPRFRSMAELLEAMRREW